MASVFDVAVLSVYALAALSSFGTALVLFNQVRINHIDHQVWRPVLTFLGCSFAGIGVQDTTMFALRFTREYYDPGVFRFLGSPAWLVISAVSALSLLLFLVTILVLNVPIRGE